MPTRFFETLTGPNVEEGRVYLRELGFSCPELTTRVRVRLYRQPGDERVLYETSHRIHTPLQSNPYSTSLPFGDDEASAAHKAVRDITMHYESAVNAGHAPDEAWFVPNPSY